MEPVTVKFPHDEIAVIRQLAESGGFEGLSDYVRHLVALDRELKRKQFLALKPIFEAAQEMSKSNTVGRGMPGQDIER